MSIDAVPPPPSEAGLLDGERAALPESIRLHLGRLLARAYERADDASDAADRFADLLGRLDTALRDAHDEADAAFRANLSAVVPALRRFALSLAREPSAADDLVQDTLLRAWRGRSGFAPGTNFEAWAFTILRNHFYSERRKHGREVQDEDGAHAARLAAAPEQVGRLDLADLRTALDRLPTVMREALVLVAVEGVTYEDAARILGCELGTVKSRVSRARVRLSEILGYGGEEVGVDPLTLSAMEGSA